MELVKKKFFLYLAIILAKWLGKLPSKLPSEFRLAPQPVPLSSSASSA